MLKKTRIAVLVSGGGTNLQALLDAQQNGIIQSGEILLREPSFLSTTLITPTSSPSASMKKYVVHGCSKRARILPMSSAAGLMS